jgi:hypothetical protein
MLVYSLALPREKKLLNATWVRSQRVADPSEDIGGFERFEFATNHTTLGQKRTDKGVRFSHASLVLDGHEAVLSVYVVVDPGIRHHRRYAMMWNTNPHGPIVEDSSGSVQMARKDLRQSKDRTKSAER